MEQQKPTVTEPRRVAGVTGGDILFEDFDFSFNQQISHVDNLQRAVEQYGAAIKEAKSCMQNVNECLAEFYEDFWPKHKEYGVALKDSNVMWGTLTRHVHELGEPIRRFKQLGLDAQKYLKSHDAKLTEGRVSNRIKEKHGDGNPGVFQDMLQTGSDDRREKLKGVNDEMVEDLNQLFQQRGGFVIDIFKSVYTAHRDFYSESTKIAGAVLDMVIDLENTRLEMSVGQGRHRRVASTNKPRIGWAHTSPITPSNQASPPTNQSSSIPPPPLLSGPRKQRDVKQGGVQDIARLTSVSAPVREKNPVEFGGRNETVVIQPGNKGTFKQQRGRTKQEAQDIARPTVVSKAEREKNPVEFTHGNETLVTSRGPDHPSLKRKTPPSSPLHGMANSSNGKGPPGGRGTGLRSVNMGAVGHGRGVGRGGGGRGIMIDHTGRPII